MPWNFRGPPGGAWELQLQLREDDSGAARAGSRDNDTGQVNAPKAMARISRCSVTSSEWKLGVHGPRVFGDPDGPPAQGPITLGGWR